MKIYETEDNEEYVKSMTDYKEPIIADEEEVHLNLTNTPLLVDVPNIDKLPNEQYALLRKNGLGTSDASIVLKVNPYKTLQELIAEKARNYLTEEEKAVGDEIAVKKGRDLEPLIILKFQNLFGQKNWKPSDMYVHKDFPYLKFNFDGVTGTPEQYIPCEIKVVTKKGERHYAPERAMFHEKIGFRPLQPNHAITNNSIQTKAGLYGIPPYYYTQLQQQIFGLNAPFGYLSVLYESSWTFITFMIHRDERVITDLILEGAKVWDKIEALKAGMPIMPEPKSWSDIKHEEYLDTQEYWKNKKADDKRRDI